MDKVSKQNARGMRMKRRWMIRNKCRDCLWNNRAKHGVDFCIFPRCIRPEKPAVPGGEAEGGGAR